MLKYRKWGDLEKIIICMSDYSTNLREASEEVEGSGRGEIEVDGREDMEFHPRNVSDGVCVVGDVDKVLGGRG